MGLKMSVFEDGFKVNFVPTVEDLEAARDMGRRFCTELLIICQFCMERTGNIFPVRFSVLSDEKKPGINSTLCE